MLENFVKKDMTIPSIIASAIWRCIKYADYLQIVAHTLKSKIHVNTV
jgi:hypothetical protein